MKAVSSVERRLASLQGRGRLVARTVVHAALIAGVVDKAQALAEVARAHGRSGYDPAG